MKKVVVIYYQKDRISVEMSKGMAKFLQDRGIATFDPQSELQPGAHICEASHKAMSEADYAFVFFSKSFFLTSGRHWELLNMASDLVRLMPHDAVFIIPILVDNCYEEFRRSPYGKIWPWNLSEAATKEECNQLIDQNIQLLP